jgi:metal-responsive CopG/Arc/MetJ family transcriptional regulator
MASSPKRKAPAKPAVKLRGRRRPIALTLPPELVDEIDAVAAKESRSRVMMIEIACREYVQAHQRRSVA